MKKLIIILSVFLAVSTAATAQMSTKPSKEATQKTTYVCPMHPNEMSMKEGKCPKCGMELVKTTKTQLNTSVKGSQASTVVEAKYVCKMDGSTSDKSGKCPKCGMEMTKQEVQKTTYACPMHPGEMSMTEGECSKCGMKLVKTELKYNSAVKGSQSSSKLVTKYVCSMDGATSDKPGKCPKCGMKLTEMEGAKMKDKEMEENHKH